MPFYLNKHNLNKPNYYSKYIKVKIIVAILL